MWFAVDIGAGVSPMLAPLSKAMRFVDLVHIDVYFRSGKAIQQREISAITAADSSTRQLF